ncbi:hypothetical protein GCM10017687_28300 [Streptomyces echinatus]
MTTDPRIRQLAEARYRNGYGATAADAWDNLDPSLREYLTNEAAAWLRAAVEAGIAPSTERPTDDHDAVYVDEEGLLYGEYRTVPASDCVVRLVWGQRAGRVDAGAERPLRRRVPPHRLERVTPPPSRGPAPDHHTPSHPRRPAPCRSTAPATAPSTSP